MRAYRIFASILIGALLAGMAAMPAKAELSRLNDEELQHIRAKSGIHTIGADSFFTDQPACLAADPEQETSRNRNRQWERLNLGLLEEAPLITMTDVQIRARINPGESYTELVSNSASDKFRVHCRLEDFRISLEHFSADAIYPAGKTNGASYGAIEISGGSMRISGDVYIGIIP